MSYLPSNIRVSRELPPVVAVVVLPLLLVKPLKLGSSLMMKFESVCRGIYEGWISFQMKDKNPI